MRPPDARTDNAGSHDEESADPGELKLVPPLALDRELRDDVARGAEEAGLQDLGAPGVAVHHPAVPPPRRTHLWGYLVLTGAAHLQITIYYWPPRITIKHLVKYMLNIIRGFN